MSEPNFQQDIIYLIKHLSKLLQLDFDERLSRFGLTSAQGRVLFFIYKNEKIDKKEVHQNDIEKAFSLAKSTVNGYISRLIKNGFITKKNIHPYASLEITEDGINVISEIKKGRIETTNKLFSGYSEEEKEIVIKHLQILVSNLEGGNSYVAED